MIEKRTHRSVAYSQHGDNRTDLSGALSVASVYSHSASNLAQISRINAGNSEEFKLDHLPINSFYLGKDSSFRQLVVMVESHKTSIRFYDVDYKRALN